MRLTDLNPTLDGTTGEGTLTFNCPLGHPHTISVPIGMIGQHSLRSIPRVWGATGAFPDSLTLTPSITSHVGAPIDESLSDGKHQAEYDAAAKCGWHGFVRSGEVTNA